jgi:hypothetical protein
MPHHPVTGNDDWQGISAVGRADGSRSLQRFVQPTGQFAVADDLAIGDMEQFCPYSFLEMGTPKFKRQIEFLQTPFKIG